MCVCSPLQSTDRMNSIRYARPREPSMLGNIRRTEHLKEEDKAPATTHTAGTDVSMSVRRVFVCVCVCVCEREMSPHLQRGLLLPPAGQRLAGGCERHSGTELRSRGRQQAHSYQDYYC